MDFKYNWKKHKNFAHIILGFIILGFWCFVFECWLAPKQDLWDAIFISSVVTAAATEYIQALLKLGSNTWQGIFKTSLPAILFFIYKLFMELT